MAKSGNKSNKSQKSKNAKANKANKAQNLQQYAGLINPYFTSGFGVQSGQTSSPNPNYTSPMNNALSGAATGMGLYNMWNQGNSGGGNVAGDAYMPGNMQR